MAAHANLAAAAVTPAKQPPLPRAHNLSLPPELRNRIYRCALVSSEPIHVRFTETKVKDRDSWNWDAGEKWSCSFTMEAPLTMTNHQIRCEARGIFINENTFEVNGQDFIHLPDGFRAFRSWCQATGAHFPLICVRKYGTMYHQGRYWGLAEAAFTAKQAGKTISVTNVSFTEKTYIPAYDTVSLCCEHHIEQLALRFDDIFDLLEEFRQHWTDNPMTRSNSGFEKMFRKCKFCVEEE